MLQEFTLNRGRAIINFSLKYCDNRQKILSSYAFKKVVEAFIQRLKKDNQIIYNFFIKEFDNDEYLGSSLIEVIKLMTVCDMNELLEVNNKFAPFFKDREVFIELTELLYNYWRRLERVTIVHNTRVGHGLQNVRFIQANQLLNELILSIYRRTEETVMGYSHSVYRETIAGANAGLMLNDIQWNCPIEYQGLSSIPFIGTVVINPPYITYTKMNTRSGIFEESQSNPLSNVILNEDDWFLYPAKVGNLMAFVYYHKDFMCHGLGLANLFELAKENEYVGKKPDLIYVFGYPDGHEEKRTFYYKDKKNDILIGYANYCDEIDYFGYMKKMLLTLHNIKQMERGNLPIHGAMVNIVLKSGKEANIVIMGDSGAGKSESLEAFRTLNEKYIRHMRIIFDDMGYLEFDPNGIVKGYGTEIGAFVRTDDLDPTYAFEQLDRGIYSNPDRINARVTIPVATYNTISKGYTVDYMLYANNYDESDTKISFFDDMTEAIKIFEDGARKAKGTTSEKGLVKSYFANPFGPVQEKERAEGLVRKYFKALYDEKVKVGQIHTSLAIDGRTKEGPREAAEELFSMINE
ncbi:phosphoenolpyruvate carboxykinase [Bacteroides propionicifaciens]|uniref:phosphoenolpyruvate carboxykinase n=1 Tax=Bacteroides propionicifaciens TaxID=392838 RepID=UPI00037D1C86|nr:phosphoenolpyruvate carboxykinase [Bacteroides propionicifaciens]